MLSQGISMRSSNPEDAAATRAGQGATVGVAVGGAQKDWVTQPLPVILWWGTPIAIGVSTDLFGPSTRTAAFAWAVSFVWMATGCLLNARRCHRLHCYISAPVFLLGAIAVGLLAAGFAGFGPHALNNAVSATFVLALLSFLPEIIWKRYAQSN
jgi:hypothetical protein